jgi:hypothetical protein
MLKIITENPDVRSLFTASADVLSKYSSDGSVPDKIIGQVSLSVLKQITGSSFFSVCKVNELASLAGICYSTEHKQLFQSLHCVDWSNMHPDTREYVGALLVNYLKGNIAMANT